MTGITKTARQYREELLVTIKKVIDNARNERVDDILVVGDLNQDVESPRIAQFMRENGLIEVYGCVNEIDGNERDRMYE